VQRSFSAPNPKPAYPRRDFDLNKYFKRGRGYLTGDNAVLRFPSARILELIHQGYATRIFLILPDLTQAGKSRPGTNE
jgi:hypothetical protein